MDSKNKKTPKSFSIFAFFNTNVAINMRNRVLGFVFTIFFFFLYHRKSISDTRNSFRLLARMCFVNRKREREREKKIYEKTVYIST